MLISRHQQLKTPCQGEVFMVGCFRVDCG